ncbi:MAG: NlpC/P60 family protein [Lachnospiraceae bacterium]|nr:NlpC/P60 family protein [Lachnospiraceae bacterium]
MRKIKTMGYKRSTIGRRRFCAALLVMVLTGSLAAGACSVPEVYAKTEAEKKRDEYKKKLNDTKEDIENIKDDQASVSSDLKTAAANMNALLDKQETLKGEIKNKQAEVEKANASLTEAKKVEKEQYEAMKLRIQYMYENSTDNSIWTAILESDGLADMLNRIEYASDLHQSDRDLMDSYELAVQKVEDWQAQLAEEMDGLLAMQDKYQAQQGELETMIASLEQKKEDYADQLAQAKEQAEDYKKTISKQEEIIRAQEAAAAQANADTYDGGGTGASGGLGGDAYLQDPSYNPSNSTSVSGADVVAYAQQFVGNPYVWGGNSLTNGCDCSGFVHLVFQHFGISTPRYSQAFKNVGQPVAYQNIQAGDVVVYPGHVAIYIGNGCIVEAQSTRAGITNTRSVNCHTITAIRRLV